PRAGQPNPHLAEWQGVSVFPPSREVPFGLLQVPIVERPEARLRSRFEQIRGLQPARLQAAPRYVTTALPQIAGQIAQDIYQLQTFPKPDALFQQPAIIQGSGRKQM